MSRASQDPNRYYRTGIAMTLPRKAIFDQRLAALGMKTVGDLMTLFTNAEGVVEALLPVVEQFKIQQPKISAAKREKLLEQLKLMSPDDVASLMTQAGRE